MASTPTRRKRRRRCPSCRRWNESGKEWCFWCQSSLARAKPWKMTAGRVRYIHALAGRKGLDEEIYRHRLKAWTGCDHCTQLKKDQFAAFVAGLESLPDVG